MKEDWARWDFELDRAGRFRLEALQGCGKGSGRAEVEFAIEDRKLRLTVEDTGHFQNFVLRDVGEFNLAAGKHELSVRPRTKPGVAVMDLRELRLLPIQ